jgi:hypothetical protein
MIYYGYYNVSSGQTYNREPITDTNKARLVKTMRSITYGSCPVGNYATWAVTNGHKPIAEGRVRR